MISKLHIKAKSRINNDFIYGLLVKIVIICSQLVVVPVYINTLGKEVYGEWLMISTIPTYLMLSDLGLTVTVSNQISGYNVKKEYNQMTALFKATNLFILIIGCLILVTFVGSVFFVDYRPLLNIKLIDHESIIVILSLLIINVILTLLLNFNLAYFKVLDLYYINQKYIFINYFSDLVTTIIALVFFGDIVLIPVFFVINRVLLLVLSINNLNRYENYKYGFSRDFEEVRKVIPSSLSYSLYSLGFGLILQGNTLVVGRLLGTKEVVDFNTTRTLMNAIRSFMSILYLPKMPKYNILINSLEYKKLRILFKENIFLVSSSSIFIGIFIFLFYDKLFDLWLHKRLDLPTLFIVTMIISSVLHTIWNAMSMVLLAVNKTYELLLFPVLGIFSLFIQSLYLKANGISFTSINLLIIDLLMLLIMAWKVRSILNTKQ